MAKHKAKKIPPRSQPFHGTGRGDSKPRNKDGESALPDIPVPVVHPHAGGAQHTPHTSAETEATNAAADSKRWLLPIGMAVGLILFVIVGLPAISSFLLKPKEKVTPPIASAPIANAPTTGAGSANAPTQNTPPAAQAPAPERGLVAMLPKSDGSIFGTDQTSANAFFQARTDLVGGKSPMVVRNSLEALLPNLSANPGREHVLAALSLLALRTRDANKAGEYLDALLKDFPSTNYKELAQAMQLEVALSKVAPQNKEDAPNVAAMDAVASQGRELVGRLTSTDAKAYAEMIVAQAAEQSEKKAEAAQAYLTVASNYPDSAQAATSLLRAGAIYQKLGSVDKAKAAFDTLIQKYPAENAAKEGRKYARELSIIGKPAPELAVVSVASGEPVSMSSLKGKVVLVNFWQTWCPHCRHELPHLNELYTKYKDKGLVIVGATRDDKQQNEQQLMEFLQSNPQTFPILRVEQSTARDYAVSGIPAAALVDRQGVVQWRAHPGSLTDAQIETLLAAN